MKFKFTSKKCKDGFYIKFKAVCKCGQKIKFHCPMPDEAIDVTCIKCGQNFTTKERTC